MKTKTIEIIVRNNYNRITNNYTSVIFLRDLSRVKQGYITMFSPVFFPYAGVYKQVSLKHYHNNTIPLPTRKKIVTKNMAIVVLFHQIYSDHKIVIKKKLHEINYNQQSLNTQIFSLFSFLQNQIELFIRTQEMSTVINDLKSEIHTIKIKANDKQMDTLFMETFCKFYHDITHFYFKNHHSLKDYVKLSKKIAEKNDLGFFWDSLVTIIRIVDKILLDCTMQNNKLEVSPYI